MMHPSRFGLAAAAVTFLVDQASKEWLLSIVDIREPLNVAPFFNLVMVWNRGMSFGMFPADSPSQTALLIGIAVVIVAVLLQWLKKTDTRRVAGALGLVIGGAVGNVADRLRFGAVADFFDVHVGIYHWPAFNVADSAICIGVLILCLDSLFTRHKPDAG